ncbi:MAG TPA: serine/threonine-protein kinase [Thermoanaerobaculia bacterium]|nr:serine/threonine-protein kinase [Thermoanaerobaculia bacterium]
MTEIHCLRCKDPIDSALDACPSCGEKVTLFQRTYATKLIDGKYQIIDRLGVGGMGEIFKVRHIHLNELRVIKIMRPNIAADDQGLQRFLQEARTSTMIKHRNLAMLYDFSTLDDGSYYMVWEFIDGTNIQKWMGTNGAVPARLAVEIAIQSLHGLDHLHSMGLIHRDISPENIMLSQDQKGKLLAKVIDFGIAKQLAEGEGGQGLTQTGMFLGKLKYASPEQAGFIKEGETLDARSDLYSFGIVLYEMLAGKAPFQATNPHGYILKHATEKPVPIAQMNPQITLDQKLEASLFKALEKDRDNRHASAADFATELEALRDQIAPDKKYGLGERMITLSGAQTLVDLAKPARTGSGTSSGPAPKIGGRGVSSTRDAGAEATMIDGGGASSQATVIERKGGAEATVVEALHGSAAPTVIEQKYGGPSGSEATVMDQPLAGLRGAPVEKKRSPAIYGIAAAIALMVAAGVWFALRPKTGTDVVTSTAAPGGTGASTGGKSTLIFLASPSGRLEEIIDQETQRPVTLTEEDRDVPSRISLAPGKYDVVISQDGKRQTFPVSLEPGKVERIKPELSPKIDYEPLYKELQKP